MEGSFTLPSNSVCALGKDTPRGPTGHFGPTEGQPQTQEASWLYQQRIGLLFEFQFPWTSHELFQCRNFLIGSFSAKVPVKKSSLLPRQPASL